VNRLDAIRFIINNLSGDELLIHANGAISRESFYCSDRDRNFYMLGSMGLASSLGLGIAVNRPDSRVIILDGDGNILMGLGSLALIGASKPPNLVHIVLDNGVYGTTGNQPTVSPSIQLDQVARASGYQNTCCVQSAEELSDALQNLTREQGPHFIHIKVNREVSRACPRIPYTARQIKERFMNSLP
jgi:sulfopyruvate decarboxylase beta subunit